MLNLFLECNFHESTRILMGFLSNPAILSSLKQQIHWIPSAGGGCLERRRTTTLDLGQVRPWRPSVSGTQLRGRKRWKLGWKLRWNMYTKTAYKQQVHTQNPGKTPGLVVVWFEYSPHLQLGLVVEVGVYWWFEGSTGDQDLYLGW